MALWGVLHIVECVVRKSREEKKLHRFRRSQHNVCTTYRSPEPSPLCLSFSGAAVNHNWKFKNILFLCSSWIRIRARECRLPFEARHFSGEDFYGRPQPPRDCAVEYNGRIVGRQQRLNAPEETLLFLTQFFFFNSNFDLIISWLFEECFVISGICGIVVSTLRFFRSSLFD